MEYPLAGTVLNVEYSVRRRPDGQQKIRHLIRLSNAFAGWRGPDSIFYKLSVCFQCRPVNVLTDLAILGSMVIHGGFTSRHHIKDETS